MFNARHRDDDGDESDAFDGTELPTLRSSTSSGSEDEGASDSHHQPYPLLSLRDSQVHSMKRSADRLLRKQSTSDSLRSRPVRVMLLGIVVSSCAGCDLTDS